MTVGTSPYFTCILHGCLKVACALVLMFLLISLQQKTLAGVFTDFLSAVFTSHSNECFILEKCSGEGFWSLPASFITEMISYIIC